MNRQIVPPLGGKGTRREFLGRLTAGGAGATLAGSTLPGAMACAAQEPPPTETGSTGLELTISCQHYDRTLPLLDGTVKLEGISPKFVVLGSRDRHHRMLANQEFDVSELSLSSYLITRTLDMPFKAIPVFPHRRFRHGYVYVNKDAGISKPTDLAGKRMCLRRYQNTASTWMRGIMSDDFGFDRRSVSWLIEDEEELPVNLPDDLSRARLPEGRTMIEMLEAGELDAAISGGPLPLTGNIRRLFPNYKEVELDYFKRTGFVPPMHTLVIKDEIMAQHPWVAASLWKAFEAAKKVCYDYHSDQRRSSLIWFGNAWEEQRAILGEDPWPHDLEANRKAIETLSRYQVEDGLVAEPVNVDDAFHKLDV
jgi:4,5-dihydroxyphthalate decarboxylase